jgi:integrase
MFTTVFGNPFTDRTWSAEWIKWRRAAGWPEDSQHSGFHALRHSTLQITLETYVHFWPRRGIVDEALKSAAAGRWDIP